MFLRIGHKGADAIAPGNTLESFAAAVEAGVDAIEFDVLRPRVGLRRRPPTGATPPPGPAPSTEPLVVAHDWADAARREPLTLGEASTRSREPPLDGVRFDLDLKVAGREDEIVAALRERGLIERAMTSTMEVAERRLPARPRARARPRLDAPEGRPRLVARHAAAARSSSPARPCCARACPSIVRRRAPELGVWAIWVYHPLITPRLIAAAHDVGRQGDRLDRRRARADRRARRARRRRDLLERSAIC